MVVGLEDQVGEAIFFSLTGQVTLLAFFPQDRQVYFIFFTISRLSCNSFKNCKLPCSETDQFRTLVLTLPIQLKAEKPAKLLYIYCFISSSLRSWIRLQNPKHGSSSSYSHSNYEAWECPEQWLSCRQHLLHGRWCLWHSSAQRLPNNTT